MKRLIIASIFLTIISCKNENNYDDDRELCRILGEMTENDQKYRNSPQLSEPFFKILDSLRITENLTREQYKKLPKEKQLEYGKRARAIADRIPKVDKKEKDSIWNLQIKFDEKNTELLIDITNKRGWVSREELGCEEYISPWVIFRHSPEKYWKEIRPIIEKEYAEKRMVAGDYIMIDNHLKGRPMIDLNKKLNEMVKD